MTDIFGDQYPFANTNPLENAITSGVNEHEKFLSQSKRKAKLGKEIARAVLPWVITIGSIVGVSAYVSQQHGPRPTLQPVEYGPPNR